MLLCQDSKQPMVGNIEALTITYTLPRVPYYTDSIFTVYPRALFQLLRPRNPKPLNPKP